MVRRRRPGGGALLPGPPARTGPRPAPARPGAAPARAARRRWTVAPNPEHHVAARVQHLEAVAKRADRRGAPAMADRPGCRRDERPSRWSSAVWRRATGRSAGGDRPSSPGPRPRAPRARARGRAGRPPAGGAPRSAPAGRPRPPASAPAACGSWARHPRRPGSRAGARGACGSGRPRRPLAGDEQRPAHELVDARQLGRALPPAASSALPVAMAAG